MLALERFQGIYFYGGIVDFRRAIDGLSLYVQQALGKQAELFGPNLFLFVSRDRRKMKVLYWDRTGFALWYKRLEKDRFPLPRSREATTIELEKSQLEWLLSGVEWWRMKRHAPVTLEKVG